MFNLQSFLEIARQRQTAIAAIRVSVIVGTALNLLNQGGPLFAADWAGITWWKIGFTYLVPYCVSTYNLTITRLRFDPGARAPESAHLECQKCHAHITVMNEQIIPDCPNCASHSDWEPVREGLDKG